MGVLRWITNRPCIIGFEQSNTTYVLAVYLFCHYGIHTSNHLVACKLWFSRFPHSQRKNFLHIFKDPLAPRPPSPLPSTPNQPHPLRFRFRSSTCHPALPLCDVRIAKEREKGKKRFGRGGLESGNEEREECFREREMDFGRVMGEPIFLSETRWADCVEGNELGKKKAEYFTQRNNR